MVIHWGDVTARLRSALITADITRVEAVLQEGRGVTEAAPGVSADLAPVAKHIRAEFRDVESQVLNVKAVAQLKRGLRCGRIAGEVGALELGGVDVADLEAAIADADDKGCTFPETVHLQNTARFVVRVRKLVMKEAWDAVRKELDVRPACGWFLATWR